MKRILCVFISLLILSLCGCSEYAEPDVNTLMADIISSQQFEADMTSADEKTICMLFEFVAEKAEVCAVSYSGKGGLADMIAIFKISDSADLSADIALTEQALSDYKSARYDDFKGYAPFEAEKIEKGEVMIYGKYILLVIVPDISEARTVIDSSFKV